MELAVVIYNGRGGGGGSGRFVFSVVEILVSARRPFSGSY